MKILLISKWVAGATKGDFFYPGVWRDTFELAKALTHNGCEVAILTPKINLNHEKRFNCEFGQTLLKDKIRHYIADTSIAFGRDWGAFRLRFFIAELAAVKNFKPDIIQYMQFGVSILYPFVNKKPIIFYSCYFNKHYPQEDQDLKIKERDWGVQNNILTFIWFNIQNFLYLILNTFIGSRTIESIIKKKATLVLMHKQGYEQIRKVFRQKENIYYIQKGIDISEVKKLKKVKPKADVEKKNKKILFMGSILYGKGIFNLVKAFEKVQKKVNNVELIIAGSGPASLVNRLKNYIAQTHLKINYLGGISYQNKWNVFRRADIFCLPSYRDSYPSVIFEAQAVNLPVITTYEIDSPVIDGKTGLLVPAKDIKRLAEAMINLVNNSILRKNISDRAKQNLRFYDWNKAAEKFKKLYQNLLNNV